MLPTSNKGNTREYAAQILSTITAGGAYNNIALKNALSQSEYSALDRAFITELVNGTCRNLMFIDHCLQSFSNTPLQKIKPLLLSVLRISVYQIFYMDKVPPFAACNEAVDIAKKHFGKLSGFTNGLLRNLIRNKDAVPLPALGTLTYLSVKYSFPLWLLKKLGAAWSFEQTEDFCRLSNAAPRVNLCVNGLKTTRTQLLERLRAEGVEAEESEHLELCLSIGGVNLSELAAYKEGLFHVMDESSVLAVRCLGLERERATKVGIAMRDCNAMKEDNATRDCNVMKEGNATRGVNAMKDNFTVLDLCSAPGGKSFLMGQTLLNKGQIKSRDLSEKKLGLLKTEAARLGLENLSIKVSDATVFDKDLEAWADVVLVDAPCTGFGVIRKKPDIKYTKTEADIKALAEIQRKILENAISYVKPGGILLYSTCTLTQEENQDQYTWIKAQGLKPESLEEWIPASMIHTTDPESVKEGYIQLMPSMTNDGFFISKFRRV